MGADEIKSCLAMADELDQKIAALIKQREYFRWRAAELIAAELESGKSQRQLAGEIGKSQSLVSFMAQVWRRFGGDYLGDGSGNRPFFQDAYRHVQKKRRADLDRYIPLASDDDDTRESKTALMVFATDPKKFLIEYIKSVMAWIDSFTSNCSRCGGNHKVEAARVFDPLITALTAWVESNFEDTPDTNVLARMFRPFPSTRPCTRAPRKPN